MKHLKNLVKIFGILMILFAAFMTLTCRTGAKGELLDMTYVYDENTIYWPTAKGFELKKLAWEVGGGRLLVCIQ